MHMNTYTSLTISSQNLKPHVHLAFISRIVALTSNPQQYCGIAITREKLLFFFDKRKRKPSLFWWGGKSLTIYIWWCHSVLEMNVKFQFFFPVTWNPANSWLYYWFLARNYIYKLVWRDFSPFWRIHK